jgi:hypothetical protein
LLPNCNLFFVGCVQFNFEFVFVSFAASLSFACLNSAQERRGRKPKRPIDDCDSDTTTAAAASASSARKADINDANQTKTAAQVRGLFAAPIFALCLGLT